MCEVLLRVRDKVNDDPIKDAKCTKRGDVIHVAPDGWPWGRDELSLPFYRILALPNVPMAEAEAFLGPELDDDLKNPSRVLQRRSHKLDVDHPDLPTDVRAHIDDDARLQPIFTWPVHPVKTLLHQSHGFRDFKVRRPKLHDPKVIG